MPDPGAHCLPQAFDSPQCRIRSLPSFQAVPIHRSTGYQPAFTLVELMVVVALIGILATVIGFSIEGGGQSMALGNAQRNVMSAIQAARAGATIQHTRARLIIYADKNVVPGEAASSEIINSKILRYYGVIYAESDNPHEPTRGTEPAKPFVMWTAATNGDYLPNGIYFVPSKSSSYASDVPAFSTPKTSAVDDSQGDYTIGQSALGNSPGYAPYDVHSTGITTGIMQINFPLTSAQEGDASAEWYYFIEFAPDGFYYNTNGNNNVIIGTAQPTSDSSISFLGTGANPNLMFTGVQLRALGGPAPFRGPEDFQSAGPKVFAALSATFYLTHSLCSPCPLPSISPGCAAALTAFPWSRSSSRLASWASPSSPSLASLPRP